jgi:hypothetical protein
MNSTFSDHKTEQQEDRDQQKNIFKYPLSFLPDELFRFLSNGQKRVFNFNDDWRNLMNTNKLYFAELKMQSRYITLRTNSGQFLSDPFFRRRILSLVDDPSLQISCSFHFLGKGGEHYDANSLCSLNQILISNCNARSFSVFTNVEEFRMFSRCHLSDFNCFMQIKKVLSIAIHNHNSNPTYDLSCLSPRLEHISLYVPRVVNYHLLTNLRSMEFNGCDTITDVSCFRHAEIVRLTRCRNATNVISLTGVKELALISCHGITDVSELGTVKEMIISGCRNLHDLSGLATVHTLTTSSFPVNLLASLNQNTVLKLSGFNLASIQFLTGTTLLRQLQIPDNKSIVDISMLHTVETFDITDCHSVTSLTGLTALKELKMTGVEGVESGLKFSSN